MEGVHGRAVHSVVGRRRDRGAGGGSPRAADARGEGRVRHRRSELELRVLRRGGRTDRGAEHPDGGRPRRRPDQQGRRARRAGDARFPPRSRSPRPGIPPSRRAVRHVIGEECRATDHNISLGPAVDIARVPVGGRTFESFGEDPLLQSRIGVAVVRGIQSQGVQACAKHYAINNQEDHRNSVDAVIDERTMRELYLPSFEALIREGEVASMMGSFNRVNGDFACENPSCCRGPARDVRLPRLDHERLRREPLHRAGRERGPRPGAAERGLLGRAAGRGRAARRGRRERRSTPRCATSCAR